MIDFVNKEKRCPDCGETKSLDDFPRHKRTKDGHHTYCKPCHNLRGRESIKKNHGNTRHYHLKRRYGIGEVEVQEMAEAQGFACSICQDPLDAMHVDHDHATGKVRGILCFTCNVGLGNFKDDPRRLERAAEYLRGA